MGLFFDSSKPTLYLPCFTLVDAPKLVPLPGISYKVSFEKVSITPVLSEYKRNDAFRRNPCLREIKPNIAQNEVVVDSSVVKSCIEFHRKYGSRKGKDSDDDVPMYIVLLPYEATNISVGVACKIVSVEVEDDVVTITFKSVVRVENKQPILNMKQKLWKSIVVELDDRVELLSWDQKEIDGFISTFLKLFDDTNRILKEFKTKYSLASKKSSDERSRMLYLSPLANTLYLQLNRSHFNRSWNLLKIYLTEVKTEENIHDTCFELSSMMDLMMSILPMTLKQRLDFLATKKLKERSALFFNLIQELQQLFQKLDDGIEYINQHFSDSPNIEKSILISSQLRALRFYIDDIKRSNSSPTLKPTPKNGIPTGRKASSNSPETKPDDFDSGSDAKDEIEQIKGFINSLDKKGVHPDGIKLLRKDFMRFSKMTAQNADYQVLRNYFDIVMDIPFGKTLSRETIDLMQSKAKLNSDHYGLQSVKYRLIEYLSVLKLSELTEAVSREQLQNSRKLRKSPILLLVGPPGVGKTSIAKSVADVLGRKFQRISLGGIHNEAEIRGHRRTYVGSMCGLIVNALRKAGTMNPLILLDEIDKVTSGGVGGYGNRVNGDPGSALLEVLDPEQNSSFTDHYVGFPIDLSRILFFCTANELEGISEPLLNRMEVIEIPGYTPEEKIMIGSKFLLPKQIKANGLDAVKGIPKLCLSSDAWNSVVLEYTREPGVRGLERKLSAIVRGKVMEYFTNKEIKGEVKKEDLYRYLGLARHPISEDILAPTEHSESFGIVNGLSYNSDGTGSVLVFEVIKTNSDDIANGSNASGPHINTTGNLGSILEESIRLATSFVRHILLRGLIPILDQKQIQEFLSSEYHLHVPMGAVSKDGPSAGVAITLAILSCALQRPVSPKICMTGEMTLRGKVLPIGGVKEKLLGAQLYNMQHVLIPAGNRSEIVQALATENEQQYKLYMDTEYPELRILHEKTSLQVHYCSDFFDVIKHTWPDIFKRSSLNVSSARM